MNIFKNLKYNRSVKNAGWLIGGKIVQMVVNLIVGLLTARYLGPSNYGLINYAAAYISFFSPLCTLGINAVIVKEFVDHPENDEMILGSSLGLRLVSSFLSALTIIGISCVVDADSTTTQIVVALSTVGMVFHVFEVFSYWFQYRLQSKVTAIVTLIAYVITALYRVVLLVTGKDVVFFAFATSIDYICLAIMLYLSYRKYGGRKLKLSKECGLSIFKKSHHFILSGLMVAIYGQTDKLMLKHMMDSAEVGYYSTAASICTVWCFVLSAIIDSLYPSILESFKRSREEFDKKNKLLYVIVFYVSIGVSVLFVVFGELIIKILYGEAYLPAVMPLRVITWYTAFSYLGVARNAWIVSLDKQKYLKYVYLIAAISNVILNAVLIPLWGATGAAVASLVAQIITTFVAPFLIKDLRENSILMLKAITFQ